MDWHSTTDELATNERVIQMERFTVIDDGSLDYVLKCNECGEVMRFNTESLAIAFIIADTDHGIWECEDKKADNETDRMMVDLNEHLSYDAGFDAVDSIHNESISFFIN